MIEVINGDLLDATEQYIGHQTNCLSKSAAGLAKSIFDKHPYANSYLNRIEEDDLGTIKIFGNGTTERFIINMYAQFYPGHSKYPESTKDGIKTREKSFHQCLLRIAKISDLKSVAFPYLIGCALGGGDWSHYLGTLENFAKYINEKYGAKTVLYRKE